MKESIRLGTIAGVRVGINWSVLVIFLLITMGLAAGRFPLQIPGLAPAVYVAAGLGTAALFFLSLLAHELAHALVAKRNGIEVEGIVLWLFGGVAQLRGEARDPGADLRIAGVGPLVSLTLSVLFFVLVRLGDLLGASQLLMSALAWLAVINLVLAVFNLVPAAPLDGGRVLRALLWRRHGDRHRAAVTAARAGRFFGFVLVSLGLLQLVAGAGLGGLWLMLIGWFLINAAGAEERHALMRGQLSEVRVGDVMTPDPTVVPSDLTIDRFVDEYVFRHPYSVFPLAGEDRHPAGIVTLNRVKQVPPEERSRTRVQDIACSPEDVPVASPDDPLVDLLPRMAGCSDGRALAVESGRIVGIVSPRDVAHRLEVADLRDMGTREHV